MNTALLSEIKHFARACGLERVILFGSRARGDNRARSDIDLAVIGGDIDRFRSCLDEQVQTLLKFDVVNLSRDLPSEFRESIRKDGVILYDET